ncbi:MAG: J domain-containing protein [Clostridia bacterium]|nr:J domain-containing protein [Clostridia bacterium]
MNKKDDEKMNIQENDGDISVKEHVMSRAECLEVLGLPESADDNAVKQRYGALLRQYKRHVDEKGATYDDLEYYKRITTAYDTIMGFTHDFGDDNPTSIIPYKIRRKFAKFAAFVDQYKLLLFMGILTVCLVVLFIFQSKNNTEEDITIKFVGAYTTIQERQITEYLNDSAETFDDALVSFFTVTTKTTLLDNHAKTGAESFLSQLMAGSMDVVLIDKESYDAYVEEYAFLKLDTLLSEYEAAGGNTEALDTCYFKGLTTDKGVTIDEGIYGIEVSDSAIIRGLPKDMFTWLYDEPSGQSKSMIFAICRTSKRQDVAWNYGKELVESIVPVDVSVNFAGAHDVVLKDKLGELMESSFETLENPEIGETIVTKEDVSGAVQELSSGKWDVVLIDKDSFEALASENVFLRLDDLIKDVVKDGDGNALATYFVDVPLPDGESGGEAETPVMESGIYGIEIRGNKFFRKLSSDYLKWNDDGAEKKAETMVFAICRGTDSADKAWKFGKELFAGVKKNPANNFK